MGTRSLICALNPKTKKYKISYCHWDGYPSGNGKILLEHYKTKKDVDQLLSFGNISSLTKNIFPSPDVPHSFDKPQDDVCIFYERDRGEKDQKMRERKSIPNLGECGSEYIYILKHVKWYFKSYSNSKLRLLTKKDCEEKT